MSRWNFQSLKRVGRDGYQLSRTLFRSLVPGGRNGATTKASAVGSHSSSSSYSALFKAVLLQEAREPSHNSVAASLLRIEKEYGLMRYHGINGYLQQRFGGTSCTAMSQRQANSSPSLSGSASGTSTSNGSNGTSGPVSTAKVAFMITSFMKQSLVDELKYPTDRIKKMTPQQASLALHHQVKPDAFDEVMPQLELEFAQAQQNEQERQQQEANERKQLEASLQASAKMTSGMPAPKSRGKEVESSQETIHQPQMEFHLPSLQSLPEKKDVQQRDKTTTSSSPSLDSQTSNLISSSTPQPITHGDGNKAPTGNSLDTADSSVKNVSAVSSPSSSTSTAFGDEWYEVVEQKADGSRSRVGLYLDLKEAELGRETREMIRDKDADGSTGTRGSVFKLRQISREEV